MMIWDVDDNLDAYSQEINSNGGNQMSKISEEALNYKPAAKTKNNLIYG